MSGTNLSLHQERQLNESQLCVVMKGVRPINKEGRERYKDMMVAFENAMVEIRLGKQIQPKFLQQISKRKDDKSARPPHMRVELQSIGHKVQIYEQVRQFRVHNNRALPLSGALPGRLCTEWAGKLGRPGDRCPRPRSVSYTHLTLPTIYSV